MPEEIHKRAYAQKISEPLEGRQAGGCPECGGIRIMPDYEKGEKVCTDCGYVFPGRITDYGPEWRAFDEDQRAKRTRVGAPTTYAIHDKGLSTKIDWHDRDIYGKSLSPGQKSEFYRLRKWQSRIRVSDATEKSLAFALDEITKISNNLNLPKSARETGSVIYRKAVKEKLIRGRSMASMEGASVYLACRQCGIPRDLIEVSREVTIPGKEENEVKKEIARSYRRLVKNLNNESTAYVKPVDKKQLISKLSNKMFQGFENGGKVEEIANKILKGATEAKPSLSGRSPKGMAAASIYIASTLAKGDGDGKTQREIADAADITEVTIRNVYKELMRRLMITSQH